MCTVYKRQFLPEIILRYRFIGNQHEIFDDLRCNIPLVRLNLDRFSLVIKHNLRLRKIKIDRAALHTFLRRIAASSCISSNIGTSSSYSPISFSS